MNMLCEMAEYYSLQGSSRAETRVRCKVKETATTSVQNALGTRMREICYMR